jgi:hypothetical protein
MKTLSLSLLLGAVVAAAAPAVASEATAAPDPLATLFPENVPRALVVAVPPSEGARQLERAVGDALHDSGRVGRVVPSSVIGSYVGLGPQEIATRALKLPIDAVVIASTSSDGATVLSATYRNGGQRGPAPWVPVVHKAEETPAAKKPAPEGVTPPELPPPEGVTPPELPEHAKEAPAPAPPPPPSFDESFVGFKETAKNAKVTQPYEGRYMRVLDWPEFYAKVGRPDLADRSQTRRTWSKVLLGGGIIVSLAGVLSVSLDGVAGGGGRGTIAGAVLQGVGLVTILGGSLMPRDVVPAWEARRLGEQYNWRLRQQTGAPAN